MAGIEVDGARPAVEWVTSLPRSWRLSEGERLVMLALACDSFDGHDTYPGREALAEWTGMHASSVGDILARLERPTSHRPALIRRESGKGGRGRRARIVLLGPRDVLSRLMGKPAGEPGGNEADKLTGEPGGYRGRKPTDKPTGKPTAKPAGEPGTSLPFPPRKRATCPNGRPYADDGTCCEAPETHAQAETG